MFLGSDRWSVPSLRAVAESDHPIEGVFTKTPRPGRRGAPAVPTPVADAARGLDLPLREVASVVEGSGFEQLRASAPDVLVVVAYGEILPAAVLQVPRLGAVNVHFSLLPKLRGAGPVQHALLRGDPRTGVTTILMDEGVDTGPILLQELVDIRPDDDAATLGDRLASAGAALLMRTLDGLSRGEIRPTPQDSRAATFAPKLTASDRRLDWTEPAARVAGRVRAFAPEPGAVTRFRGSTLKVIRAEASEGSGEPGLILGVAGGMTVACGSGAVHLLEVSPEGRKRMAAEAFARGARLRPGEYLG